MYFREMKTPALPGLKPGTLAPHCPRYPGPGIQMTGAL